MFERSILGQYESFILGNVNELKFTEKTTKGKAITMLPNEHIFLHLLCITDALSEHCPCYLKESLLTDNGLLTTFYISAITL